MTVVVVLLCIAIIVLVIIGANNDDNYLAQHHCKRTGQERIAAFQKMGEMMMPIYASEYTCNNNETFWR